MCWVTREDVCSGYSCYMPTEKDAWRRQRTRLLHFVSGVNWSAGLGRFMNLDGVGIDWGSFFLF